MLDAEIVERPRQTCDEHAALDPEVLSEQIGIAQREAHPCAIDHLVGKVGPAADPRIETVGDRGGAALDHAVGQRETGRERSGIAQRAAGESRRAETAAPLAQHAVAACVIGDAECRDRLVRCAPDRPRHRRAAPALPRAVADDPRRIAAIELRQPRQHASGRGERIARKLEPVAIGLGIEQQREAVARTQPRVCIDQCAALADIDFGGEVRPLVARSGEPLGDHQILDHQPVHPDVEIGQQRRIGVAGEQFGQPRQPPAPRGDLADVEPAPQPVQRPPVEPHLGDGEEGALGIAHRHLPQQRVAVDVALDPPDGEPQARSGRGRRDLVGDETLADRGGEEQRHEQEGCEQQPQRPARALAPALTPRCLARRRRCAVLHRVRHQNACPRLT